MVTSMIGCPNGKFHHRCTSSLPCQLTYCISIRDVRFLTMLREPVSQALSWESMTINHEYYLSYPKKQCAEKRSLRMDSKSPVAYLRTQLGTIRNCIDTEYRKNITFQLVAHMVASWSTSDDSVNGYPGAAVSLSSSYIMGNRKAYNRLKGSDIIGYMKAKYFLVGVVERINEFLVLIGLHMGWDLASLYYITCKPTDLDVHRKEFAHYFPELEAKLERSSRPSKEAYEWAKEEFDSHVNRLGPWFQDLVADFKRGLSQYQIRHRHPQKYRWTDYTYLDGHVEDC
jgi:hypothetical protein